jgi:hypothetical protein
MHKLRQRDRCGIDEIPPALSFLRQRDVGAALRRRQRQGSLSGQVERLERASNASLPDMRTMVTAYGLFILAVIAFYLYLGIVNR